MKQFFFISFMLFVFINSNSQTTLVKNNIYEVLYSETLQQPINISYEYPMYNYIEVEELKYTLVVNEVGYPDSSKKTNEWQVPTNIISSNKDDYILPYHRGHVVPAASFKYAEHQRFIYSYLNCAIMHKDLNQGVWKTLEYRERELSEKFKVKVRVELVFSDKKNTNDAGATIPSSFRKIIEYRKKGLIDLNKNYDIKTETYEFPNNDSVKNTDLASYKI